MNHRGIATLGILVIVIAFIFAASSYLRATAAQSTYTPKLQNAGALSGSTPVSNPSCVDKDSRVNTVCTQPDQPVAVYCQPSGDIRLIPLPADNKEYIIPASLINAVPANPQVNTYIGSINLPTYGVTVTLKLYRLHGGKLQVNVPRPYTTDHKEYVFSWDGCASKN